MGHLALALFHLSHSNISYLKIPQIDISCFEILFASDENDEILCLRCCVCGYECDDTERKADRERWHLDEFLPRWDSGSDDRMKQLQKMEQLNWILSHPRPRRSGCVRRIEEGKACHSRQQLKCQQQRAARRRCGIPTTCS